MHRGKLTIVVIFVVALAMSGYAWWHHYRQSRRCLELWGGEAAELIRFAPQVDALRLREMGDSEPTRTAAAESPIDIQGRPHEVTAAVAVQAMPGFLHARQALVEDGGFLWDQAAGKTGRWTHAFRFRDGPRRVHVAFDLEAGSVTLVETGATARLVQSRVQAYASRFPVWLEGMPASQGAEHLEQEATE